MYQKNKHIIGFYAYILIGLGFLSCASDEATPAQGASEAEIKYFEDYESPSNKWGFINTNNELVIKYKYDDVRDFSEGIAAVNYKGKWGFVNKQDKIIIPVEFREVKPYKGGICFANDFEDNWTAFNAKGDRIGSYVVDEISSYNSNYIIAKKGFAWGVIDLQNNEILSFKYRSIKRIHDLFYAKDETGYSPFDKTGNPIKSNLNLDEIYTTNEALIRIKKDKKYGYVDENAKAIIPPKYQKAFDFQGQNTIVKDGDKYEFIDYTGKLLKTLEYDRIQPIGNRKWKYKLDQKWGILSPDCTELTPPIYHLLNRYIDGFISYAEDNDHWGYLNASAKTVIPAILPLTWDYKNGYVRFIDAQGIGFLDTTGIPIIPPSYFEVRDFYEGFAGVQKR